MRRDALRKVPERAALGTSVRDRDAVMGAVTELLERRPRSRFVVETCAETSA